MVDGTTFVGVPLRVHPSLTTEVGCRPLDGYRETNSNLRLCWAPDGHRGSHSNLRRGGTEVGVLLTSGKTVEQTLEHFPGLSPVG